MVLWERLSGFDADTIGSSFQVFQDPFKLPEMPMKQANDGQKV